MTTYRVPMQIVPLPSNRVSSGLAAGVPGRAATPASAALAYPRPDPHAAPVGYRHLRLAESVPREKPAHGIPEDGRPIPRTEEAARLADALAVTLRGAVDRATLPLALAARAFVETEAWVAFGYARLEDHARERFGRTGRWVRDLAALGRMFSTLPGIEAAVCGMDGQAPVGRVAGLLIGRVASPESAAAWIERARALSVRDLRSEVARAHEAGSSWPPDADPRARAAGAASADSLVNADDDAPRSLVRVEMPSPVLAAFDEALDLFRVIEGREATVTEFIEALVAEASASSPPSESVEGALGELLSRGEAVAIRERAFARSTRSWEHLPEVPGADGTGPEWALHLAGFTLARLAALESEAGRGTASDLDSQMRQLLELEDALERRLAEVLSRMADSGAWTRLRFDSAVHYAEQRLGMGRTATRQRLRVVRALRRLPEVRHAYERGVLGAEAAWLASRMIGPLGADRPVEREWVERARLATVKRLRDEARLAARRGLEPEERDGRESTTATRSNDAGGIADDVAAHPPGSRRPATDAEWHASLHRRVGTARRRLARLGRAAAPRMGSDVFLRLRLPTSLALDLLGAIESARRCLDRLVAEVPWEEPWPEPDPPGSLLAARDCFVRCRRTPAWAGLLALLEDFVGTWDVEHARSRRSGQATHERSGWRCSAPGCTSRKNLEDHHIVYRARQGGDEPWNRLSLCRFHHQIGEHGGLASARGRAPLGVTWSLGRLACGGWFRNELKLGGPSPSPRCTAPSEGPW